MYAAQLIIAGVLTGAVYALVAVGLTIIYRSSNVLNFAHGYIAALAAYVSLSLATSHGLGWPLAILIAIALSAAVNLLIDVVVIEPLRSARPLTLVVATLGVALILDGVITMAFGTNPTLYPNVVSGNAVTVAGLVISWQDVVLLITTFAVLGFLGLLLSRTTLGLSMRAASESRENAALLGINFRLVSMASWGIAGVLAGVAGILVAPRASLTPDAITTLMIQGFSAIVLAGFTSIGGAVVGGFVTGIVLNLVSGYIVSDAPSTVLFVLLIVVLLVRPNGLFGGNREEVRL